MPSSSDLLKGSQPKGRERWRALLGCGVALLMGACSSASDDSRGEATGGSAESGSAAQSGGTDDPGGASAEGTGGTTGGTAAVVGTGGVGDNPSGGSGGSPTGSSGGSESGGSGGTPTGGSGSDSTGGSGGSETGGSAGTLTGGSPAGGSETGGGQPGGSENGGAGTGGSATGGIETGGAQTGGGGPCDDPGTLHSGGFEYCENGSGDLGNGYQYAAWAGGGGSMCMTLFGDEATFKCDWSDSLDFLAGTGLIYDRTQTPDQIGIFSADFAFTGSSTGLVYIGAYGWTQDPRTEFYIIEDWIDDSGAAPPAPGTDMGTITVDGGTYTVRQDRLVGDPTIVDQYYSIRTGGRQCGHISISEHFAQWADKGLELGRLDRVLLFVEGMGGGDGSYEFTRATLTVQ